MLKFFELLKGTSRVLTRVSLHSKLFPDLNGNRNLTAWMSTVYTRFPVSVGTEWDFRCLMSPGATDSPCSFAPKLMVVKEGRENHGIIELSLVMVSASSPAPRAESCTVFLEVLLSGDGHSESSTHPFFYLRIHGNRPPFWKTLAFVMAFPLVCHSGWRDRKPRWENSKVEGAPEWLHDPLYIPRLLISLF